MHKSKSKKQTNMQDNLRIINNSDHLQDHPEIKNSIDDASLPDYIEDYRTLFSGVLSAEANP
jgi:hypothetical protein